MFCRHYDTYMGLRIPEDFTGKYLRDNSGLHTSYGSTGTHSFMSTRTRDPVTTYRFSPLLINTYTQYSSLYPSPPSCTISLPFNLVILAANKPLADLLLELSTENFRHFDESFAGNMGRASTFATLRSHGSISIVLLIRWFQWFMMIMHPWWLGRKQSHPSHSNNPYDMHAAGGLCARRLFYGRTYKRQAKLYLLVPLANIKILRKSDHHQ
jgi:hypothetical protein